MPIVVSFAVNDHRGLPIGKASAIHVHGDDVDIELEPNAAEIAVRFAALEKQFQTYEGDRTVIVGNLHIPCFGYTPHFANWCWDATKIRAVHVLNLLYMLRENGWHCRAAECAFYDAWESGDRLTPELLNFALSDEPSPNASRESKL